MARQVRPCHARAALRPAAVRRKTARQGIWIWSTRLRWYELRPSRWPASLLSCAPSCVQHPQLCASVRPSRHSSVAPPAGVQLHRAERSRPRPALAASLDRLQLEPAQHTRCVQQTHAAKLDNAGRDSAHGFDVDWASAPGTLLGAPPLTWPLQLPRHCMCAQYATRPSPRHAIVRYGESLTAVPACLAPPR